jgi:hypothetical protein
LSETPVPEHTPLEEWQKGSAEYQPRSRYRFWIDKREAGSFEAMYLDFLAEEDLDGDGMKEVVFWARDRGQKYFFVLLSFRLNRLFILEASELPEKRFLDVDGDGVDEFVLVRDRFGFDGKLCLACMPEIRAVVGYRNGTFFLKPASMKRLDPPVSLPDRIYRVRYDRQVDEFRFDEEREIAGVLEEAISALYRGEMERSLALIRWRIVFETPRARELLVRSIFEDLRDSLFFRQILLQNGLIRKSEENLSARQLSERARKRFLRRLDGANP